MATLTDETGSNVLFRFADPLITWHWLNSYPENALVDILGPIDKWCVTKPYYLWQTTSANERQQFISNKTLKATGLTLNYLTTVNGSIVWSARYKSYGNLALLEVNEVINPLRFQGQYYDKETGLHYNSYRYYNPNIGRYLTPDLLKLAGGLNNYQYTSNPINWVDPLGLLECPGDPTPKKPTGNYAKPEREKDPANKQALTRQNETADLLGSKGYEVEMLPETKGGNGYGIDPTKNPDFKVNGEVYDVYSPQGGNERNVISEVTRKSQEQTHKIILNLSDYKGSIPEIEKRLMTEKIDTLHDVVIIKPDQSITTLPLPK